MATSSPQAADNRLTLNNTASTVSNFRCDPANSGTFDAKFVSTSIVPSDGMGNFWYLDRRDQPVTVEMLNSGTRTWDSRVALTLVTPADNKNQSGGQLLDETKFSLAPGERIAPGSKKLFSFSFVGNGRAPQFQWQLAVNGMPFGERTPSVFLMPKGF